MIQDLEIKRATLENSTPKAIAHLINQVYSIEEAPVWKEGHLRTSEAFIIRAIEKNEIITAFLNGALAGVVHTKQLNSDLGWFGMLVVPDKLRRNGIAYKLYLASESLMMELGCTKMQCEVLVPEKPVIPMKKALQNWYARLGYTIDSSRPMTDLYPRVKDDLTMACELEIYLKDLK